jgi:hypothetical protein
MVKRTANPIERYIVLYIPWLLSLLFSNDAIVSYFIAWLGSFFIFFICYSGYIKPLPTDRSIGEQLMRPIFLVQIVFVGYMACSSIFYFLNLLGVNDLSGQGIYFTVDKEKLALTAKCQQYYVLGHAAVASGMILFMNYDFKPQYRTDRNKLANVIFQIAVISLPISILSIRIPGLSQFYFQFSSLSFIAGTLALAFAIPLKKAATIFFSLLLYVSNFYQALTSGFKEPIIISVLVLGIFLYPNYKKIVTLVFGPALLMLFIFLPTYNHVFRENAWGDNVDSDEAYKLALDATINGDEEEDNSTWGFLVFRLSEVDMFTTYLQSTPANVDYYGFTLVKQSAVAIVPRILWPGKPITEDWVMERVYNAGVVKRGSIVSAKPAYIVDGYLSWGIPGVFISLFIFGALAQSISVKAEQLFGGYVLGTALIYSGLFQIFWRGLSFEFLVNSVFWSYVTMLMVHKILLKKRILEKI